LTQIRPEIIFIFQKSECVHILELSVSLAFSGKNIYRAQQVAVLIIQFHYNN
jgi:hypothetical protein